MHWQLPAEVAGSAAARASARVRRHGCASDRAHRPSCRALPRSSRARRRVDGAFSPAAQIGAHLLLSARLILRRLDLGSAEPRHERRSLCLGQAQCALRLVELARQLRKPVGIRASGLLRGGNFLPRGVVRLSKPLPGHAQRLLRSAKFLAELRDCYLRCRPFRDSRPLIMNGFRAAIYRARRPRHGRQPQCDGTMLPPPSRRPPDLIRQRRCRRNPDFRKRPPRQRKSSVIAVPHTSSTVAAGI